MSNTNTYTLTISPDKKSWSLTINSTAVLTNETKLIHKPLITKLFASHGYGKPMTVGTKIVYCPCEGVDEAFVVYKQLVLAGFKP